jgi:hypothetical protein
MTLNSKSLAVIILLAIFGGITFSSAMGWWVTESTKVPVTFTEGKFAGQANPADIRGSYTFGDIANSFDVAPEVLAQAFGVTGDDPAAFAVKELEAIYIDSGYEIGTASVRLFVAWYTGLPFDTTGQEIFLPRSATELLLAKGNLSPDQAAYLEAHTVEVGMPIQETAPATPVTASAPSTETIVKGKTTFGELLAWGVPQVMIEQIIGGPIPGPATTLKDYATAKGLDFETLKSALQAEVDKVNP